MVKKNIRNIGIVGCGLMGAGIAHVSARAGFKTLVADVDKNTLNRGIDRIFTFIDKGIERGKTTADERNIVESNLTGTIELDDFSACDLIIEAVPEKIDLKRDVFTSLKPILNEETILSSNTSSIRITALSEFTDRPDRFLGTHFFNPVPIMKLCEIVRTKKTSQETFNSVDNFVSAIGKTPISCTDTTGFVVNRLLTPYLLNAVRAFEAGLASIIDIDNAMMLGCGYPMGPLTLIDFVGVETVAHISGIMHCEFKLPQYETPALLKKMVEAGWYGKKSKMGFYDYSGGEPYPNDEELRTL